MFEANSLSTSIDDPHKSRSSVTWRPSCRLWPSPVRQPSDRVTWEIMSSHRRLQLAAEPLSRRASGGSWTYDFP